jgi:hypothetical protein
MSHDESSGERGQSARVGRLSVPSPSLGTRLASAITAICNLLRGRASDPASVPVGVEGRNQAEDDQEQKRWLGLVEECAALLDELERNRESLEPSARELADHVELRLQEILERSGVMVIADETTFDRGRHQAERGASRARPGDAILETLRPGLAVGRRVLRRAIVRLASDGSGPNA